MERYWTLQYLRQQGITELEATAIRDGLVRADTLPLRVERLASLWSYLLSICNAPV